MANTEKGEKDLILSGKTLRFKLGTSGLIELQEMFSAPETVAAINAREDASALRTALRQYGRHVAPCEGKPCSCGFDDALFGLGDGGTVAAIPGILAEVSRGRLKYIRAFIWAGLRKFHSEFTIDQVSDLLDDCEESEIAGVVAALGMSTSPDPKDVQELRQGVKKNPRKARTRATRGTGGTSTSMPAASV